MTTMQRTNIDLLNRTLFIHDNLPVLQGIDSGSVALIATDPPFNKGVRAFEGLVTAGMDAKGKKVSYKDVWNWSDVQESWVSSIREDHPKLHAVIQAANMAAGEDMGAFLCWLGVRLLEMHRILRDDGSIYLHIDHTAHAWVKAMMDAIFGRGNFKNEIVWKRNNANNAGTKKLGTITDSILFYVKSDAAIFNQLYYTQWSEAQIQRYKADEQGRMYKTADLTAPGAYTARQFTWRGATPPATRSWAYDESTLESLYADGRILLTRHGKPRLDGLIRYLDEMPSGGKIQNLWDDIARVGNTSAERTGYPTQKPLALYERIIGISSNEGDLVLDPFAGCATTAIAAERLGRGWIAIDINTEAQDVIRARLEKEAQLPTNAQSWDRAVNIMTTPPERTDDGQAAAPELTLVSPQPRAPRLTARELRERLVERDGMQCQGCGWIPPHEEHMEVDHRTPKSVGGRDDLHNRVLLCGPCNGAKGNKLNLAELRQRRLEEGRMLDPGWTQDWFDRVGKFGDPI